MIAVLDKMGLRVMVITSMGTNEMSTMEHGGKKLWRRARRTRIWSETMREISGKTKGKKRTMIQTQKMRKTKKTKKRRKMRKKKRMGKTKRPGKAKRPGKEL